jgi:hypothetical protein
MTPSHLTSDLVIVVVHFRNAADGFGEKLGFTFLLESILLISNLRIWSSFWFEIVTFYGFKMI